MFFVATERTMATSFNLVVLLGHMTADPDIRYTSKGSAITKFSIGVNRAWKSAEGVPNTEVSFFDCEVWGRLAETIAQNFKKGNPILVRGRLKQDTWEDRDTHQRRSRVKVVVEEFQFVSSKEGQGAELEPEAEAEADALTPQPARRPSSFRSPPPSLKDDDDDIPF